MTNSSLIVWYLKCYFFFPKVSQTRINIFYSSTKLERRNICLIFNVWRAPSFFSWIFVLPSFRSFEFSSEKIEQSHGGLRCILLHVNWAYVVHINALCIWVNIIMPVLLAHTQFLFGWSWLWGNPKCGTCILDHVVWLGLPFSQLIEIEFLNPVRSLGILWNN